MIGVAKNDLSVDLLPEFAEMNSLDTATRTYRHKYRCAYFAVVGGDDACACITHWVGMLQCEVHFLRLYGFTVIRLCGYAVIRLCGFAVIRFCGFADKL